MPDKLANADYLHDRHLPLILIRRDPQTEYPLHSHEFSELVLVYRGTGRHILPGGTREIAAGDVFLIHGNVRHAYTGLHDLALCNVIFDLHEWNNPLSAFPRQSALRSLFRLEVSGNSSRGLRLGGSDLTEAVRLVNRIEEEQNLGAEDSPGAMAALFVLLVLHLGRCSKASGLAEASAPLLRLSGLIDDLHEHSDRKWTRSGMARTAGMSASTLTRHFKERTGYSPLEYLIMIRLKKAAQLLMNPEMSIADAADRVGFSDSNYFCRQFRRHFGTSPGRYRKE